MTCNAWSHHADCNCGWGGIFYPPSADDCRSDSDRFRKANAICPVCRASVFFYRSPSGGRVYFDELHPPWPKHPCTDRPSTAMEAGARKQAPSPSHLPDPAHHWRPLICRSIGKGGQCTELEVTGSDEVRVLYGRIKDKMLDIAAPFFIRFVSKGTYEISTLGTQEGLPQEVRFTAFSHLGGLMEANRPKKEPRPEPVRPVAVPEQIGAPHVHYWHDPASLSSVPVTYLSRGKKAGPGRKPSSSSVMHAHKPSVLPSRKRAKK